MDKNMICPEALAEALASDAVPTGEYFPEWDRNRGARAVLPHTGPAVFVEDAWVFPEQKVAVVRKHFSRQSWLWRIFPWLAGPFWGHFPGNPVLKGVYAPEMVAQAAGLLMPGMEGIGGLGMLMGIKDFDIRQAIIPGEEVLVISKLVEGPRHRQVMLEGSVWKGKIPFAWWPGNDYTRELNLVGFGTVRAMVVKPATTEES